MHDCVIASAPFPQDGILETIDDDVETGKPPKRVGAIAGAGAAGAGSTVVGTLAMRSGNSGASTPKSRRRPSAISGLLTDTGSDGPSGACLEGCAAGQEGRG